MSDFLIYAARLQDELRVVPRKQQRRDQMKHTSEPWRVEDDGTFVEVMAGEKTVLPAIRKVEAAADFRRIVACVNACAGVTTEELEQGGFAAGEA